MGQFQSEHIRSIAIVGQGGSGKTTLIEQLLARSKSIPSAGTVEKGNTVCDYDPLEKTHGHSLKLAVAHTQYKDTLVHLIDTPGYMDFLGQALPALSAVETAAVVVNAQSGIELLTTRMMQWAGERDLCRIIIVNKIDAENVDHRALLAQLQDTFGKECLPINLPAEGGKRVVDCFFDPSHQSDIFSVQQAHTALVDQVVEVDEELMALYLEQGHVTPEQLHAPFEKALREGHLVPVCFVSARTGAGLDLLLETFARLMPNPAEGNPPMFIKGEGAQAHALQAEPDAGKHVLAHVFKIEIDPFIGKLAVFRVEQGTVRPGSQLFVGDGRKPFKVVHLYRLQGKQHIEVQQALPGDICAVAKVEEMQFGDVLHDAPEDDHIHIRPLQFPAPVFGLAVEPQKRGDEGKLMDVLHKLESEDPSLRIERSAGSHETVIRGLGELHLRRLLEKMEKHHQLTLTTHPPRIPYVETITAKADGHHRHKKQTGGAGQFGEVFLRVEPLPRGTGFEFVDDIHGGTIPTQFLPAVEKGVRQALEAGPVTGHPVHDVRVIVYDGKHHPVDSKEVAFVAAGKKAFLDALTKAHPVVLEPIVSVDVYAPADALGDIAGELSGKRGHVNGNDAGNNGLMKLSARAPLAEMESFQSRLKSLTGGQGSYTLAFSHYDPAPPNVQAHLASQYKPTLHDD